MANPEDLQQLQHLGLRPVPDLAHPGVPAEQAQRPGGGGPAGVRERLPGAGGGLRLRPAGGENAPGAAEPLGDGEMGRENGDVGTHTHIYIQSLLVQ